MSLFEVVGGSKTRALTARVLVSGCVESVVVIVVVGGSRVPMLVAVVAGSTRSLSMVGFGAVVVGGVFVVRHWVDFILRPFVAIFVVCCAEKEKEGKETKS
mgnify:CR=1 FL=1